MGISGLLNFAEGRWPGAFKPIGRGPARGGRGGAKRPVHPAARTAEHVLVDLSSILHKAVRRAKKKVGDAVFFVMRELDHIFKKVCRPTHSILIAFDGPASHSKIRTQRKRRLRAAVDSLSLQLTPGSALIEEVYEGVLYWVCSRIHNDRAYSRVDVFVSGPDVPGEAEIKVFGRIAKVLAQSRRLPRTPRFIVVGGDADLLVLALAGHCQSVTIYADNKTPTFIDMGVVVRELAKLPGNSAWTCLDTVVLMLMCGNDYLPAVRGTNLERLMDGYARARALFPQQHLLVLDERHKPTLNWEFFRLVALPVFKKKFRQQPKMWRKKRGSSALDYSWDLVAGSPDECVRSYLEGLLWNVEMYRAGSCWDYRSTYHFRSGPSLVDLLAVGPRVAASVRVPRSGAPPLHPHGVLMCLLPKDAVDVVPEHLRPLMAEGGG